jgi:hypothetical protein
MVTGRRVARGVADAAARSAIPLVCLVMNIYCLDHQVATSAARDPMKQVLFGPGEGSDQ